MGKVHINNNKDIKPCTAEVGNCPFGRHFDSFKAAEEYISDKQEKIFYLNMFNLARSVPPQNFVSYLSHLPRHYHPTEPWLSVHAASDHLGDFFGEDPYLFSSLPETKQKIDEYAKLAEEVTREYPLSGLQKESEEYQENLRERDRKLRGTVEDLYKVVAKEYFDYCSKHEENEKNIHQILANDGFFKISDPNKKRDVLIDKVREEVLSKNLSDKKSESEIAFLKHSLNLALSEEEKSINLIKKLEESSSNSEKDRRKITKLKKEITEYKVGIANTMIKSLTLAQVQKET